ncbi:MAG: extracellular solute-binding protein [Ruthenibacterium lactatiformans]
MPLNDLLDVYGQDILNGVSEDSWRAVSGEDGNIYGIPYKYPYAQEVQGFMVCRWDLMQEAGIEAIPTTIDEFYDCLVKLKEHFGDQYIIFSGPYRSASEGNGTWIFPQAIAAAFGIYNDWMVDEDGKVYYMTEHENFGKMIEFLSKCQQEGCRPDQRKHLVHRAGKACRRQGDHRSDQPQRPGRDHSHHA